MLHRVSPLRVSVRPDFDMLDVSVPDGAPTRTDDGKPWVRWAKYGSFSGWYALGSRKPSLTVGRLSFWEAVFAVACECAGGTMDQAHCCGRGVLSLGGLGVTMRSGYAQLLLYCCLQAQPARFLEVMAPIIQATGMCLKTTDKSPSGVAVSVNGACLLSEELMRDAVTAGSDSETWTRKQKERAKVWVSCCSQLLRDESMDKAQLTFLEEVAPALLTAETRVAIKWTQTGPRDWWQYTHEQQLLWGLALVLSLEDELQTERLILGARAVQRAIKDAPMSAEHVIRQMLDQVQDKSYESVFRERCLRATKALATFMQVTL